MANVAVDEDQRWLLNCLSATLNPNQEVRSFAEASLNQASLQPVFSLIAAFSLRKAKKEARAIKNAPGCIRPLASRILPYLGPVLNKPQQQPDGLVAGSLDLLTMLLKASDTWQEEFCDIQNAPTDVVKAAYDVCFDGIIRIVLQGEDHSEMQVAWSGNFCFVCEMLLNACTCMKKVKKLFRLLDPDLESSGSLFVGSYILQLILHLPSQMGQHIQDLIVALVRRMQSASIAGLKSSLLLIFARLIHMSAPNVEQFINLVITIPAEGYKMPLFTLHLISLLMCVLCSAGEIQGAYQIKVTTSALALLLSTRHPELTNINVKGHLIKHMAGITTRSKAKSAPDQWTMVPLPAKILALLADALIEIQEQVRDAEDEFLSPTPGFLYCQGLILSLVVPLPQVMIIITVGVCLCFEPFVLEDSDWEEIHEGDMESDKDSLSSAAAAPFGWSANELQLEAMAKAYNENQDDDYEDDTLSIADPLNEVCMVSVRIKSSAT
ncbi:hypothetical protein REPUB_Repub04eG0229800 [Reevesia pubescens]